MPTTVHIPDRLLRAVDRRAKTLHLSRNRLIVRALEREIQAASSWSPEFLAWLRQPDADRSDDVDDMLSEITRARRSKAPVEL